jgi:hypothetical protein
MDKEIVWEFSSDLIKWFKEYLVEEDIGLRVIDFGEENKIRWVWFKEWVR